MRFGKSVWHSRRVNEANAEIAEFDTPKEIITRPNYLTCMPAVARGYLEILRFGETLSDTWTIIANAKNFDNVFHKGDLMWVDGLKPDELVEAVYGNGASANAIVKNVAEVNTTINITLERYQGQERNETVDKP